MSDPVFTTALVLGSTLPTAAIAWAAGRIGERLTSSPRLRHALWTGTIAFGLVAAAAGPTWSWLAVKKISATALPHAGDFNALTVLDSMPVVSPPPLWAGLLQSAALAMVGIALAGAALALWLFLVRLRRLNGFTGRAVMASNDVRRFVTARAETLDVSPPQVKVSTEVSTAILTGLRKPTILLPSKLVEAMSAEELHLICAHELAHLRRGDHLRAPIEGALAALLWFNPFVLNALARISAAREALCDAEALDGASLLERRLYAQTLITALRHSSADATQPAFIRRRGTEHAMRLKAILRPPVGPSKQTVIAAAGLAVVTGVFTFAVSGAVAHTMDAAASKAELALKPDIPQNTAQTREAPHPDVVFQVLFSKAGERVASPTVVGQFGRTVTIEISKTMRVEALAEKPDQNGDSLTSAKMQIYKDDVWQPAKVMSMNAKLSSTPSFEYSVEGTPYRFVVLPRMIVPAASSTTAATLKPKNQNGSIYITADKMDHRGGKMVREGNSARLEGGTIVYTGSPKVEMSGGGPDGVHMLLNGQPAPAGFDPKSVPASQIVRAEVTFLPPVDGQAAQDRNNESDHQARVDE